jgi:hypothetical protein
MLVKIIPGSRVCTEASTLFFFLFVSLAVFFVSLSSCVPLYPGLSISWLTVRRLSLSWGNATAQASPASVRMLLDDDLLCFRYVPLFVYIAVVV